MYPKKIQHLIQQEGFSQEQRKQEAWYQVYRQGSQENLHQESFQPVRETWGHMYHKLQWSM